MFWKELYSVLLQSLLILGYILTLVNGASVKAVAPLNPVREGDILSLRCQVWNLGNNQAVKISRHSTTNSQVFSYNKGLITGMDERVFLAIRQLRDGSVVYFLSIIDVQVEDEGQFSCKIMDMKDDVVVSKSSIEIKTMFFPAENFPTCWPTGTLTVHDGLPHTFNCSSDKAHPPVAIEWHRAGEDQDLDYTRDEKGSSVSSLLTIKPTMRDADAMYFCKISSKQFPDKVSTCHVGPLKVVPSSPNMRPLPIYVDTRPPEPEVVTSKVKYELDFPVGDRCKEICERSNLQSIHFWVVCTGVAAVLAIVFFIIGVFLLVKYKNTYTKPKVQYVSHHQGRDDVYTELEMRQDANKVYMAITKPPEEMVYCPKENEETHEPLEVTEPPEHKVRYV